MKQFRRFVPLNRYLADEESLLAYSYDASGAEGKPALVLKPEDPEQVRRILLHANQHHFPIVPRGAGTGTRAGAIKKGGVILDLRGFKRITNLDHQRRTIDVGAGVTIKHLQSVLATKGFSFPLIPANPAATVGGLAAINHPTEESFKYGDWLDLVESVRSFDGLGRYHTLKEVEKVVGWEGSTGIILSLRLKIVPKQPYTVDLLPVENVEEALKVGEVNASDALAIEYLDEESAAHLQLPRKPHLLLLYENDKGSYKGERAGALYRARKELPFRYFQEGYQKEIEATLPKKTLPSFVAWCRKEGYVCYGHLGLGILLTVVKTRAAEERFRNNVIAQGGKPVGKYGFGRVAATYATEDVKKRLRRLKEERDYRTILNPGVIL